MRAASRPRLLLVSMYPLDRGLWGPTARITHLRDELRRLVRLDVVSGYRLARAGGLARYLAAGRLRGLAGIYVESSTTLPGPADLAFLGTARAMRIPVLTYIRDAYQLFPEYALRATLKQRVSGRLFLPAVRALMAVSSVVAVPSRGLGEALGRPDAALLPPGSPPAVEIGRRPDADQLLYVGALRLPAFGGNILLTGVERARAEGHGVGLTCVVRPGEEPPGPHPEWVRIERASGEAIHRLLPGVLATVVPRPRNAYNDLALPTKLLEYLSYGRPLLVTDCTEQARLVREAGAGIVVPASADGLAHGIAQLCAAGSAQLDALSAAARHAAGRHAWRQRAHDVLNLLTIGT